jgi:RHS repeat-associated protein
MQTEYKYNVHTFLLINLTVIFHLQNARRETLLFYYGLRYYNGKDQVWLGVDPEWEKYPGVSPYAYCGNNPLRYTDPTGKFPIDIIWDIGNMIYDVGAAVVNHVKGDHTAAASNWTDLGMDAVAALIPYVPAGATKALKAADAVVDIAKTADKAADVGKSADKVTDTGKTFQTYTKTKSETGEVYSGRTSGKSTPEKNVQNRDANHHRRLWQCQIG